MSGVGVLPRAKAWRAGVGGAEAISGRFGSCRRQAMGFGGLRGGSNRSRDFVLCSTTLCGN